MAAGKEAGARTSPPHPKRGKAGQKDSDSLKTPGVKAGVPDINLPVARGGYHGLYIELKAGKNKTTRKQEEWIAALRQQGYHVSVCYGWEEAKETIENYLDEKPGRKEVEE